MTACDAVVLLGFGGPNRPDEIRPFLDRVLEGRAIPAARYEEVVKHYERIGGKSPFDELTRAQAQALAHDLRESAGIELPVEVAYLNSEPFVDQVAQRLRALGKTHPLGIILATFQSPASWEKYQRVPGAVYAPPYYDHPLFVEAYAQRVREALSSLGKETFEDVALIFTAHSIPQAMDDASPYSRQFTRSAELIAQAARARSWTIAYQSRSGSPSEPWLGPDVRETIAALPASGKRLAIFAPIGFLCDHVEVLYDLDVDAADTAAAAGVRIARASTLNDHPLFIKMLSGLVQQCFVLP